MEHTLFEWIRVHGSLSIFVLLVLGIAGLPVPGETLLLVAGVLVGQRRLGALPTYAAAMAGAAVGVTVSYAIGRALGVTVLRRYGHRLHIESDNLAQARAMFRRGGKWGLMFGYFVPGIRHLTALVAGAASLEFGLFSFFAYGGGCLWAVTFITVGIFVGDRWEILAQRLQASGWFLAVVIAVAAVLFFMFHRKLKKR